MSEDEFNVVLLRVTEDVVYRKELIDLELASEYTMRDFISPILVGALQLVVIFLRNSKIPGGKLPLHIRRSLLEKNLH